MIVTGPDLTDTVTTIVIVNATAAETTATVIASETGIVAATTMKPRKSARNAVAAGASAKGKGKGRGAATMTAGIVTAVNTEANMDVASMDGASVVAASTAATETVSATGTVSATETATVSETVTVSATVNARKTETVIAVAATPKMIAVDVNAHARLIACGA